MILSFIIILLYSYGGVVEYNVQYIECRGVDHWVVEVRGHAEGIMLKQRRGCIQKIYYQTIAFENGS